MKVICVIGTRPEAIKMAPVILALKKEPSIDVCVLATAQHRGLLDQVLTFFDIKPDIDLDIMRPDQSLTVLTARLLLSVGDLLQAEQPDIVLVQGDTTTVMAISLACFYQKIDVGHIEAGLRTWDMNNPFPEEANRVITGKLCQWHFAPTVGAKQNLLTEGVAEEKITVTGNTVIDSLMLTVKSDVDIGISLDKTKRLILITSHRRENFGEPFLNICKAIKTLANNNIDVEFLYPVHPNPSIKNIVHEVLADQSNITLCPPLDYAPFIAAMKRAYLIISDSGGVQEEAPALGKPVLVLRDETERPEAIKEGVVKLVGTDYQRIVDATQHLLDDKSAYTQMAKGVSPYGDGRASERILAVLKAHYS